VGYVYYYAQDHEWVVCSCTVYGLLLLTCNSSVSVIEELFTKAHNVIYPDAVTLFGDFRQNIVVLVTVVFFVRLWNVVFKPPLLDLLFEAGVSHKAGRMKRPS
jgi:hypothetical protein